MGPRGGSDSDAADTKPVARSGARQVAPTPPEERVLAPVAQRTGDTGPAGVNSAGSPDHTDHSTSDVEAAPPAEGDTGATGVEPVRPRLAAVKEPRKLPLFGLRQLGTVVRAVYAALADPISSDDERTREIRTARLRRAGIVAGSTVLAVLLVYAIFPVREFLDHREAQNRQTERRDVLQEANESQEEYLDYLESDEGIEDLAREHGFTYPGEEPVNVLPAPEEESD